MKPKYSIYLEYIDLKGGGSELNPDPYLLYTDKEIERFERAQQSWLAYRKERDNRLKKRALDILEIYDKAQKFDSLVLISKKSFWQRIKKLFRRA